MSATIRLVNRTYLPSKNILVLIAVISIAAVGIYFYTNSDDSDNIAQSISPEQREELEQTDSDNDGLSDWEESLWGTDINNPDTDGDGTSDGEEVANNRNPNDDSPDDALEDPANIASSSANQNITANLRNQILPRAFILAAAQRSGEEVTQDDIERVASSLQSSTQIESTTYTESDLNISANMSDADIRTYLQKTVNSLVLQSGQQRDPLSVIATELQDNTTRQIDLTPYITQINKVTSQLRKIAVPTRYVSDHLAIVNSTARMQAALQLMQRAESDPMSGIIGGQTYKDAMRTAEDAAEALSQKINEDLQ